MRKKLSLFITLLAISLALIQLYQSSFGFFEAYLSRSFFLTSCFVLLFLIYPLSKKEPEGKLSFGIDALLIILTVATGIYMATNNLAIVARGGDAITSDLIFGAILTLLILEAARRTIGPVLPVVVILMLAYTLLGRSMPGDLIHAGVGYRAILDWNFTTFEGMLGMPTAVLLHYIFIFFIFAALLKQTRIQEFFKDFAYATMGHRTGGLGKVSVVSSAFMGMISGSAIANVVMTGSYTIPAMKEGGYPNEFAGAIEAAASTGGQFTPPIMAAAAFLLAAFVGVPYIDVIIAATIPAILYYIAVGTTIHLVSLRYGLLGVAKETLPRLRNVLKRAYLMIPVFAMIFALLQGYSASRAALYAIVTTLILSFISKQTRLTPKRFLQGLEEAARQIPLVTAACASAGIIILLILLSGLGMKMPFLITSIAGDNVLLAAMVVALGMLVMAMGLTTTAGYIIGATLMAPVLISQYGIPAMNAHLFVLYYAVIACVTPPVAFTSFTAASMAGAGLWRTCIRAFFLAMAGFSLPFLFIMESGLLMRGSFPQIMMAIAIGLMLVTSISFALHGGGIWKKWSPLVRTLFVIIPIAIYLSYYFPDYQWVIIPAAALYALIMASKLPWQKLREIKILGRG